ncbi:Eco57I restriction-modification methylase domain-containing protein [Marinomonas sp. ef1]|uniref:Eco57I restriction-modification methylase domain-containing protein n=1 Tax=Marinomonas sp. ef1 TaxID=2005043 RepID=UPI000C28C073|nr:N-6 DNA methylase [Marinomonas sp. ef1]
MRQSLDKALRKQLETTVIKARDVVEQAVTEALTRLGVAEAQAPTYLSNAERALRNSLRAHGRQLGDKLTDGKQTTDALINEMAYEHWHRMLFARFLEQNNLLMYDEYTSVTLDECAELAEEEADCKDGLELAGRLAAKMLPQIFRTESPVFQLTLSINHTNTLESLISKLDPAVYQAQDSLGWCYQFWQTKKKQQVNESGVKIGAQELSPVTQLFTEPYMVSFLLDNALGAWWANKRLTQDDLCRANNEQELREKAAIPGVPLNYLRFVKQQESQEQEQGEPQWQLASGGFEQWPTNLSELKTLDPCCGSGHFLVAVFLMLVPMRMHQEGLSARDAVDQVIRENLHGLELDQRCVELAAFAIALEAWRFPEAGGYRALPELHLACSGLSIHAAKDEWKTISAAAGKQNLTIALDSLYQTFKDAPVLGSLINPRRSTAANIAEWTELHLALNTALQADQSHADDNQTTTVSQRIEAGIVAQGITKATELLTDQYTWVITNVPYLKRAKHSNTLSSFINKLYADSKADLATVFLERCLEFCSINGTISVVLPQNWLFLTSYKKLRLKLLTNEKINSIIRLGAGAFETISGEVVKAILLSVSPNRTPSISNDDYHEIMGLDVSNIKGALDKASLLIHSSFVKVNQYAQIKNADYFISFEGDNNASKLSEFSKGLAGILNGDSPRFLKVFWEIINRGELWSFQQTTQNVSDHYGGYQNLVLYDELNGHLREEKWIRRERLHDSDQRGQAVLGRHGIGVSSMGDLPVSIFRGNRYDSNVAAIVPSDHSIITALWCYCSSKEYFSDVRQIDQALKVTNATLVKVPFDLEYWSKVAEDQYPNGLPEPYTNDATQWIFHGHPCGSVVWDEETKWTAEGELRTDDNVAQVAVARLLGYQWPAELDPEMELSAEQRAWVERCAELTEFVDDDGIVCLPALRGEGRAAKRLVDLLMKAYGPAWSTTVEEKLLKSLKAKDWESWLREKFFEQHCKLFQNRPFIWQIWDGEKDGFSALVNYHKLDYKGLERLIYTYLDSWISHQKQDVAAGVDGADIRLIAAENLKKQLVAILEGEQGLDIFVRWKPLSEQPIGWNPDLNDGVRLNIRPFMLAKDVGKKGAGVLRAKPNVHWKKDRGTDVPSASWYHLGLEYGGKEGDRINEHHLTLQEKKIAREQVK